jgi:hypothetical protein
MRSGISLLFVRHLNHHLVRVLIPSQLVVEVSEGWPALHGNNGGYRLTNLRRRRRRSPLELMCTIRPARASYKTCMHFKLEKNSITTMVLFRSSEIVG